MLQATEGFYIASRRVIGKDACERIIAGLVEEEIEYECESLGNDTYQLVVKAPEGVSFC